MKIIRLFILLIILVCPILLLGQTKGDDTVINSNTIEILQSYKPKVRQAPKPIWIPQLAATDTSHPFFNYLVPQQSLYYTYNSELLRPLALGKDTLIIPYPNYIKVGAGNLTTLFLDAGMGGFTSTEYESYLHIHHISQQGDIKFQQTALSGLEAEGRYHSQKYDWHSTFNVERNQYNYYGYDHKLYDLKSDSVRQTYTTVKVIADVLSKANEEQFLKYHPLVTASLYTARYNAFETGLGFIAPFSYEKDTQIQYVLNVDGTMNYLKNDSAGKFNNFLELEPGVRFHNKNFRMHAYLSAAVSKNGTTHLLPDFIAKYLLSNLPITLSGGIKSSLQLNTYQDLTNENPYLTTIYSTKQTRLDEIFINIDGNLLKNLSYEARTSWWNMKNLSTFKDTTGDKNKFNLVNDTVNSISFQFALKYLVANTWSASLSGDYFNYFNGKQEFVWQQPTLKIKATINVNPIKNLAINGYFAVLDGIHVIDENKKVKNLNIISDIGANVEYWYKIRLSFFLQLNNILNSNYERWLGYQAYGFNAYGGIRLKF